MWEELEISSLGTVSGMSRKKWRAAMKEALIHISEVEVCEFGKYFGNAHSSIKIQFNISTLKVYFE